MSADYTVAAMLAAKYAQEIGLPPGNMWEPAIARTIAKRMRRGEDAFDLDHDFRAMLGLDE